MTNYCYGSNVPGYLPDGDGPGPFDDDDPLTFDDAKRGLISDMLFAADYAGSEDAATNLTLAAEDVNLWNSPEDVSVDDGTALGRVYWIAEVVD